MRSAIIAAAFAASAVAVPLQERAVVVHTDVEMVYVTDYYTVTAQGPAPTEDAVPTKEAGSHAHHNYHQAIHPHWWGGPHQDPQKHHTIEPQPAPTKEPAPTQEPAPTEQPAPTNTGWGSAPTQSPAPPSQPPSGPAPQDYQGKVLYHHNIHRANHTSPDINWSSSLAATAQKIANTCRYEHNVDMDGGGYGQNIAAGVDDSGIDRVITNMFYDSEVNDFAMNYNNPSPPGFETWGHFSQMVWINTRDVACATAHCPGGLANTGGNVPPYFTVCNYSPPGNVAGQYANNIKKPIGNPSVSV